MVERENMMMKFIRISDSVECGNHTLKDMEVVCEPDTTKNGSNSKSKHDFSVFEIEKKNKPSPVSLPRFKCFDFFFLATV